MIKLEEVYGRSFRGVLSQPEASESLGVLERSFQRWRDRDEAEEAGGVEAVAGTEKREQHIKIRSQSAARADCWPWLPRELALAKDLAKHTGQRRGPGLFGGWHNQGYALALGGAWG